MSKPPNSWTKEEDLLLIKNWNASNADIAYLLKATLGSERSANAVKKHRARAFKDVQPAKAAMLAVVRAPTEKPKTDLQATVRAAEELLIKAAEEQRIESFSIEWKVIATANVVGVRVVFRDGSEFASRNLRKVERVIYGLYADN